VWAQVFGRRSTLDVTAGGGGLEGLVGGLYAFVWHVGGMEGVGMVDKAAFVLPGGGSPAGAVIVRLSGFDQLPAIAQCACHGARKGGA
jgi:hypothetical protein